MVWLTAAAVLVLAALVVVATRDGSDDTDTAGSGGLTGGDFHSLVVDPADPLRLFVGGHTNVSVSTNGGRTWTEIEDLRDADAMGWAFIGDTVYVSGHPGLNRSADGGRTFERVNDGLPNTDVHAFGGSDDVLYGASPAVGVFASTSGPPDWEIRSADDGQPFFGRIVIDPEDPEHLFAGDAQSGVAESRDGGRTWQRVDAGLSSATWISASGDLAVLVASGPAGAARSDDSGRTWQPVELPDGASLVEVADDGTLLYAGRHSGSRVEVSVSRDGGTTWQQP
jgi:photosystem II stability/assembly factor-like uncharacterized protein